MNGSQRHSPNWNKSYWERQILYDLTYMWNPKKTSNKQKKQKKKKQTKKKTVAPEFIETENRGRELGVGETGKDGRWSNDTNLHL